MTKLTTDYSKMIEACDYISRHCTQIANTFHGSVWLADKVIRFFESEKAAISIEIPVFLNAPIMKQGTATIYRTGNYNLKICDN